MDKRDLFIDKAGYRLIGGIYEYEIKGNKEYICLTPHPSKISKEPFWWAHKIMGNGQYKITPENSKIYKEFLKKI